MKQYTAEELKEVLDKHKKWRLDEDGGQHAYLQRADLQGADLQRADLQYAYLQRADLRRANLQDADLQYAYLQRADLQGADLQRADLQYADLRYANLRYANLRGADLRRANLRGADLRYAYLRRANLQDADLQGANLQGAYLQDANLQGAYLQDAKEIPSFIQKYFKKDLLYVLEHCPKRDIEQLRIRVIEGKIQGTQYSGECACLIGSLYQIEGLMNQTEFAKSHIPYYECGLHNPSEQLFWQIREGDKPENSIFSKWALDVIDQVLGLANGGEG